MLPSGAPAGVMQCVLQLKQGLLECLGAVGGAGPLGADELFPVFVYVVLSCMQPAAPGL